MTATGGDIMPPSRLHGPWRHALAVALITVSAAASADAQVLDGYVSVMFDILPSVALRPDTQRDGPSESRHAMAELRTRVLAERRFDLGEHVRVTAVGFVEGLVADRGRQDEVTTAIVRAQELHAELLWSKADVRIGLSRLVWGRLDELQPTDVVNPLDFARFFLEGRAEGRMPVGLVRARLLPSDRFTLEGVYVPVFRRGRFDQLDELTSPFNLAPLLLEFSQEPPHTWSNAQGGVRASVTTGRVDWSLSAYRGFEPLPLYQLDSVAPESLVPVVEERFPRFTMIGGDFETVRGEWGVRGEVAAFVDRALQVGDEPLTVEGHSFEAGVGVDRRAGDYRVSGNLVIAGRASPQISSLDETDATIVVSIDRSFSRETRQLRTFAVYNPRDDSAFARVIASFSLRDNVALETSGGWFTGHGSDVLSRLKTRDFLYARLKVFF